jgi:5-(carboxyamino)imidazole ribonucleotide synthase
VENVHAGGILRRSLAPAPRVSPELQARAEAHAGRVLDALGYVGVLAIELFQIGDRLLANEMAPRVHNSGHWTIEGAETSQFENHLRAVAGLPTGSTAPRGVSAMVNLIGRVPEARAVLAIPGAHLHLYGKTPRPGRKLGHVTLRAETWPELERLRAGLEAHVGPAPAGSS